MHTSVVQLFLSLQSWLFVQTTAKLPSGTGVPGAGLLSAAAYTASSATTIEARTNS
jgi:hypothetical protein